MKCATQVSEVILTKFGLKVNPNDGQVKDLTKSSVLVEPSLSEEIVSAQSTSKLH